MGVSPGLLFPYLLLICSSPVIVHIVELPQ